MQQLDQQATKAPSQESSLHQTSHRFPDRHELTAQRMKAGCIAAATLKKSVNGLRPGCQQVLSNGKYNLEAFTHRTSRERSDPQKFFKPRQLADLNVSVTLTSALRSRTRSPPYLTG